MIIIIILFLLILLLLLIIIIIIILECSNKQGRPRRKWLDDVNLRTRIFRAVHDRTMGSDSGGNIEHHRLQPGNKPEPEIWFHASF